MFRLQFKRIVLTIVIIISATANGWAVPDYWPTKGWRRSSPEAQGVDSAGLVQLMEKIRSERLRVDSITIVRNGYLVLDAYFFPFAPGHTHRIYSCTKSITSTLVGIARDKGFIKELDQKVVAFFPGQAFANPGAGKDEITLRHLLNMTSGLETRDDKANRYRGIGRMMNSPDWVAHVLGLPMAFPPGQRFHYTNCGSFLLGAVLQKATGRDALSFARTHLFGPLGIKEVFWPVSPKGIYHGYGNMMMQPHDMAKIGFFFLNQGAWDGEQIVSAEWVRRATVTQTVPSGLTGAYGFQWWVDTGNYFSAIGNRGQFIFVVPSKNMVVVFTSNLPSRGYYPVVKALMDDRITASAPSGVPLPEKPAQNRKLEQLVAAAAKEPVGGLVWRTEPEGLAVQGRFIRKALPAFSLAYPPTSYKGAVGNDPDMILNLKTQRGNYIAVRVAPIPDGVSLSRLGSDHVPGIYRKLKFTHVKVAYHKQWDLVDGTPAFRTHVNWRTGTEYPMQTRTVSAYKDGMAVLVSVTVRAPHGIPASGNVEEAAAALDSIVFQ